MNKHGFMFVETIVTLTILLVLLATLYSSFTNLINKEKIDAEYEKKGDRYALFYIKETVLDKEYIEKYKNKYVRVSSIYGLSRAGSASDPRVKPNIAIIACNDTSEIEVGSDSYDAQCSCKDCETGYTKCIVDQPDAEFKRYVDQLKPLRSHCKEGAEYIIAGEFLNYENRDTSEGWAAGSGSFVYDNFSYAYVYYPNIKAADEE